MPAQNSQLDDKSRGTTTAVSLLLPFCPKGEDKCGMRNCGTHSGTMVRVILSERSDPKFCGMRYEWSKTNERGEEGIY